MLLILLSAEVLTTLLMGSLFGLHFFLGMVLIGPVCLKIGSTVWRFTRYYRLGALRPPGPPPMPQRVLAPAGPDLRRGWHGVMLAVERPGPLVQKLHQRFFYLWLIVVIIHLVHYLPKLPRLLTNIRPARLSAR